MMNHTISPEIFRELILLAEAFVLGAVLMAGYDFFRFLRRIVPHHDLVVALEDILFWAIAAVCIFILLYLENSGRIRYYAIGGCALGMMVFYGFWGKNWPRLLEKLLEIVKKSRIFRKKG